MYVFSLAETSISRGKTPALQGMIPSLYLPFFPSSTTTA